MENNQNDPNNFSCCFCGEAIVNKKPDPVQIVIPIPDGGNQELFAHIECLRNHLHNSVPLGIFDDNDTHKFLTVDHYIRIYDLRKNGYDIGLLKYPSERYEQVCKLLQSLKKCDREAECKLVGKSDRAEFKVNGKIVGTIYRNKFKGRSA
jgi:hypothetical protein